MLAGPPYDLEQSHEEESLEQEWLSARAMTATGWLCRTFLKFGVHGYLFCTKLLFA